MTETMHPLRGRNASFLLEFLLLSALVLVIQSGTPSRGETATADNPVILTVSGPIAPDSLGTTLIHEHVFLDWTPVEEYNPQLWDEEAAFKVILPHLQKMRSLGVQSFLECTPQYIGRNPELLRRLAEASGLRILTNTGYYGARNDQHVPAHAFEESPEALAARWIHEYQNGINGTGIRPGFIKIGVDSDSILTPIDEKLVRAAAHTHLATGLTIVAHTGPDAPARQQVRILEEMGVSPEAWVWTHAQRGSSPVHAALARRGAWISLDGMGWIAPQKGDSTALYRYLDQLVYLKENRLLDHTLISHDAGWYTAGESGGGDYQPYTNIFKFVLPELRNRGFTDDDIRMLLIENPGRAYAIRLRR